MSTPSLSRQFAAWAAKLRYEDLPPDVIDKVKAFVLHALMSAVFGSRNEHAKQAVALALAEEGKPDGASILVDGGRASRVGATYANAELMHASNLFDSYRMLTHPGPVLVPAALVNAELEGKNGRDLIVALAAGYEFNCRLCDKFIPSTAARGFRPSPIYSTMGAALTSGKLMGLDENGLVSTIALAANFASGLNEGPRSGGNELAIHEPQAARNGVFAAMMARTGHVKGAELSLEGDAGFYNAFTGSHKGELTYAFGGPMQVDPMGITAGLGREYKLTTAMFRVFPFAAYNQPVIKLMMELRQRHGLKPEDIADVAVHMNWIETLYPSPAFPRYADCQEPHVGGTKYFAAHAAVHGGYPVIGGTPFCEGDLTKDKLALDFMRQHVTLVPEKDRAMFSPAITVTMRDGTRHAGEYPYERMAWDFRALAENLRECLPGFPTGEKGYDAIVKLSSSLESVASMKAVFDLLKE